MRNSLDKKALIKLVEKICKVEGTEEEIDKMIIQLERNVPHPEVSDLIFNNEAELTPEEIIEKTLNYKSILF
ncbi:bacteriocin immunity protein [Virgibacillus byunsanensis]|uniref:Bacteriocin immunity protein n=1 Tax=Virgibacillus byunsanensis TaxID=570945 RepID=A0ABW3LSI8_9BACI